MSRTFQDANLLKWEVYASSGPHGYANPARIIFHCLSDGDRRARFIQLDGDKADAEREVAEAQEARLGELLAQSTELD